MSQVEGLQQFFRDTCPEWFEIQQDLSGEIIGAASVTLDASSAIECYLIRIDITIESVSAREISINSKLPSFCPERHINFDGSFCLSLNSSSNVKTVEDVLYWWEALEAYLKNQVVAGKTGIWPNQSSLSHGSAADYQIEAERIANKLCIYDEYQKAVVDPGSWFGVLVSKVQSNQISAKRIDELLAHVDICKTNYTKRRPLAKLARKLIFAELKRRRQDKLFWDSFDHSTTSCCGKMLSCHFNSS